jgi:hypothetical protein
MVVFVGGEPTRLVISWNMLVSRSDTNYFDFLKLKDDRSAYSTSVL